MAARCSDSRYSGMADQYIPAGRTSRVQTGDAEFQIQTEYAKRPNPRVTTTIFTKGEVLHKIEKALEFAVDSIEQMHRVEDMIKAQHTEVAKIVREKGLPASAAPAEQAAQNAPTFDRILFLDEVERVYLVTGDGRLIDPSGETSRVKRAFKHVIRELPTLLNVFASLPGERDTREDGLYEIEQGRIILGSAGTEFYLILLRQGTPYDVVAPKLKRLLQKKA